MTTDNNYLFIGGPLDGVRDYVLDGLNDYVILDFAEDDFRMITHHYLRTVLCDITVFVLASVNPIAELVKKYPESK